MDNMSIHRHSSNITTVIAYAIYENEEFIHHILHICSTKTDRSLDDGRCEYYLDVDSQQTTSQRKSIEKYFLFLNSNYSVGDSQ
ncbi:unnamed protein product [Rotaria sordida]|uniref:Uncharacterized protein n=1 Tax=Rotaria sordida TaxID=392033 RepID=A0A814YE66_9BILA|nr:unnamed protein product [Rotaria sordida]CAF1224519.1 unnamed protein product [Rotaria sordida]CAF1229338.1 unnamed protein product [Rotaria sordida]